MNTRKYTLVAEPNDLLGVVARSWRSDPGATAFGLLVCLVCLIAFLGLLMVRYDPFIVLGTVIVIGIVLFWRIFFATLMILLGLLFFRMVMGSAFMAAEWF